MVNIAIHDGASYGACQHYRSYYPLKRLREEKGDISVIRLTGKVDFEDMLNFDILFLPRANDNSHINLINLAKSANVPIWLDYDDDLENLHITNPAFPFFHERKEILKQCIAQADLITVSNDYMKEFFKNSYGREAHTVVNAVELKQIRTSKIKSPTRFVWRGGSSHLIDMDIIREDLEYGILNTKHDFWFCGLNPVVNIDCYTKPNYKFVPFGAFTGYMHHMKTVVQPDIMFFPLLNIHFNKCKSNICWLEATQLGTVLWSNFDQSEYNRKGIIHMSFKEILDMDRKDLEILRNEKLAESIEDINENYNLIKQNQIRYNLIKETI